MILQNFESTLIICLNRQHVGDMVWVAIVISNFSQSHLVQNIYMYLDMWNHDIQVPSTNRTKWFLEKWPYFKWEILNNLNNKLLGKRLIVWYHRISKHIKEMNMYATKLHIGLGLRISEWVKICWHKASKLESLTVKTPKEFHLS